MAPDTAVPAAGDSMRSQLVHRSVSQQRDLAGSEVDRIVQAAFDEMAESQSPEPSLRGVLRRAHLSTATFYRYFRSRDELLLVVLDEGSRVLTSYLHHQMGKAAGPAGKAAAWIRGFMRQAESPTAAQRTRPFAVGSSRLESAFPTEHALLYERLVSLLRSEVVTGNEVGAFNSPDPGGDAWAIFDFVRAAAFRHILAGTTPDEDAANRLVDTALRMLA